MKFKKIKNLFFLIVGLISPTVCAELESSVIDRMFADFGVTQEEVKKNPLDVDAEFVALGKQDVEHVLEKLQHIQDHISQQQEKSDETVEGSNNQKASSIVDESSDEEGIDDENGNDEGSDDEEIIEDGEGESV